LSYVNADVVDLSGFDGWVGVNAAAVGRVIGSGGADEIYVHGTVGTVEAGAGNDILGGRGAVTLLGGTGADRFTFGDHPELQLPIVGDFKKGTDTLDIGPLVTNRGYPDVGVESDFGTWYSQRISLAPGAGFNAYLNAAATKQPSSTHAAITWFQHGDDAYVVVDNSYAQSTFQNGADRHIKLVGVTDLSTLTFDAIHGLLH
jgi:Ca2+-binding RTX toxin-like protein